MDGADRKQENINERKRDEKEVREGTKGMLMTEYQHERVTLLREIWRVRSVRAYEARTSCNVRLKMIG